MAARLLECLRVPVITISDWHGQLDPLLVSGIGNAIVYTALNAIAQSWLTDKARGRVMGIYLVCHLTLAREAPIGVQFVNVNTLTNYLQ